MRDAGRFIVLEGSDGVGKSTQVALLSTWMDALGVPHLVAREPGGTPVGEAIRSVVLSRDDLEMPPESELLLILAARAAFVADVVKPALAEGTTVVADRFALSTLAYQGYGRGLDLELVRAGLEIATGGLRPDLYLLLDLPLEEAQARRRRGSGEPDRIEREGLDFQGAVRDGYLALADDEGGIEVVDARGSAEEVHARVRDRIVARFPDTFEQTATSVDDRTVGR
jgi:dTMP kinase